MQEDYILQMKNIKKSYYGNTVLDGIDLAVRKGEVLGLVGENGAGKSTLMNILFGMPVIQKSGGFDGQIIFEGKEVNISSPQTAMELGIGMVHQEFMLIPDFTVSENIKLNREITKDNIFTKLTAGMLNILDFDSMRNDSKKAFGKLGINVDVDRRVSSMSVGFKQFVEISREIDKENIKVIVFDEPTAVLSESEAEYLTDTIKTLSAAGIAVIFISHKLGEILGVCDSVVVLRDGNMVASKKASETDVLELSRLMVGRSIDTGTRASKRVLDDRNTILSIKNLKVMMPAEQVKDLTIDVRQGEILGFAGLAGQGKIGISNGIMGIFPAEGDVFFKGEKLDIGNTGDTLEKRIAFVSENRREVGLLLDETIETNIIMNALVTDSRFLRRFGPVTQIDSAAVRREAEKMIDLFKIKCSSPLQITRALSGGNQQKVCLARAIVSNPELLFISEPTRGIDIGAKKLILDYLVKINRENGVTIVITSSELQELRSICDRIAIISDGKLEGILESDASDEEFGLMMTGERRALMKRGV